MATNPTDNTQEIAFKVVDFVVDGIIYLITMIVTVFVSASPQAGDAIARKIQEFKYPILGFLASIVFVVVVFVSFLFGISTPEAIGSAGKPEATSLDGIDAVVLNVPYFNQWIEADGTNGPNRRINSRFLLGQVICGAASSTMIAGYYGKVGYDRSNAYSSLKSYAYQDNGLGHGSKCNDRGISGAFGTTAYDRRCNQSYAVGMQRWLSKVGVGSSIVYRAPRFDEIKSQIDSGNPVIVSLTTYWGAGHISVIKGYTQDGRFVMNDPWKNVQQGRNTPYSRNGENALYYSDLGSVGNFTYFLRTSV